MKPWPLLLVYYGPVHLPLISITLYDSFSHHTPASLTTNYFVRALKRYTFTVNLKQSESEDWICMTIRAGTQNDEGDDRKVCFLSRQCGWGAMCWCGTWPRAHPLPLHTAPIISHSVQSSPAMASISCFLSCSRARYVCEAVTWLPTVTQLENRDCRRASCWVTASRLSGQEALLKNKASLCFSELQGACSVRTWSSGKHFLESFLTTLAGYKQMCFPEEYFSDFCFKNPPYKKKKLPFVHIDCWHEREAY